MESTAGVPGTGSGVEQVAEDVPADVDLSSLNESMCAAMGHFCTGVVVVTSQSEDGPVGFTCQSFTSLSLDPPLISLNPARTSTSWPLIRRRGVFVVNVLADDHAHISNAFARSGGDKFAGVAWSPSPAGMPIINGCCAWVECDLRDEYDGGDHTIAVGHVSALGYAEDRVPLVYHRGGYRALVDR